MKPRFHAVVRKRLKQWLYGNYPIGAASLYSNGGKLYHMIVRKRLKKWLGGIVGSFDYFGIKVYFPRDSELYHVACEEGVYERENVRLLQKFIRPNSVYLDIGANIGFMAIPILCHSSSCTVVSFEPSPNTLAYLRRTVLGSRFSDRWKIVPKAAGSASGNQEFFSAPIGRGAYDGFRDTKRTAGMKEIDVPVTTVDEEWCSLGHPSVSVIKIDVEGAEHQVLQGAMRCIAAERPHILLEWNRTNLEAYSYAISNLLTFAASIGYQVFSVPLLLPVTDLLTLELQMLRTESFLLAPTPSACYATATVNEC